MFLGYYLDLDILDENGDPATHETPVTIGLCLPRDITLAGDAEHFNIFRFEIPTGKVTVLEEAPAPFLTNNCLDFVGSAVDASPLMRFARVMWEGVKNLLGPRVLMAFGDRGFGGSSDMESFFVWARTLEFEGSRLHLNSGRSDKDWYEVQGRFAIEERDFDPINQWVRVQLGNTLVAEIEPGSFVLEDGLLRYEIPRQNSNSGVVDMVIDPSTGEFTFVTRNQDLSGLDPDFVSFCLQIGDAMQGVGIKYDDKGRGTAQGGFAH